MSLMALVAMLEPWQIWLIAALVIMILDLVVLGGMLSGGGGVTMVLVGGAFGAMIASLFGAELNGQVATGIGGMMVIALIVFWANRNWVHAKSEPTMDDPRADQVLTVEKGPSGLRVRFLGDAFPARAAPGTGSIQEGDAVRILKFEGITAIVTPASQEATSNRGN